jgi:hypothetical protein
MNLSAMAVTRELEHHSAIGSGSVGEIGLVGQE